MLDINAYLETALWASNEGPDDHSFEDEEYLANLQQELDSFWEATQHLYTEDEIDDNAIEHDFFLTRNGHGSGFWDGDYQNGDELSKIAESYGEDNGY